jgi:hypothetical protein
VLNRLFLMFGVDASQPGWSLADAVLVIKVVIGVLAAAVGALAVRAAAKDDRKPAGTSRTGLQTKHGADRLAPRHQTLPGALERSRRGARAHQLIKVGSIAAVESAY